MAITIPFDSIRFDSSYCQFLNTHAHAYAQHASSDSSTSDVLVMLTHRSGFNSSCHVTSVSLPHQTRLVHTRPKSTRCRRGRWNDAGSSACPRSLTWETDRTRANPNAATTRTHLPNTPNTPNTQTPTADPSTSGNTRSEVMASCQAGLDHRVNLFRTSY